MFMVMFVRYKRLQILWLKVWKGLELVDNEDHLKGVLLMMKRRIFKVL